MRLKAPVGTKSCSVGGITLYCDDSGHVETPEGLDVATLLESHGFKVAAPILRVAPQDVSRGTDRKGK